MFLFWSGRLLQLLFRISRLSLALLIGTHDNNAHGASVPMYILLCCCASAIAVDEPQYFAPVIRQMSAHRVIKRPPVCIAAQALTMICIWLGGLLSGPFRFFALRIMRDCALITEEGLLHNIVSPFQALLDRHPWSKICVKKLPP